MVMLSLPGKVPQSTVDLIFEQYEKRQGDGLRAHLGASLIGEPCRRKLWYGFRWAKKNKFTGRLLRLFATGQLEEARFIDDLKSVGIEVHEFTPEGEQFRVAHHGGHFGGSLDGCALGIPEAPKTWHVLEFKTHNEKSFKKLCSDGLLKSKPLHYAQMQVYMGLTGMDRAFYLARNKDNDDLYQERIHFERSFFEMLLEKAREIIFSQYPLAKINESPAWFECRFCDYHEICHTKKLPEVNCRTCLHSTPKPDGSWICEKHKRVLSVEEQKAGCENHLFITTFIGKAVDSGHGYVEYDDGTKNLEGGAVI